MFREFICQPRRFLHAKFWKRLQNVKIGIRNKENWPKIVSSAKISFLKMYLFPRKFMSAKKKSMLKIAIYSPVKKCNFFHRGEDNKNNKSTVPRVEKMHFFYVFYVRSYRWKASEEPYKLKCFMQKWKTMEKNEEEYLSKNHYIS